MADIFANLKTRRGPMKAPTKSAHDRLARLSATKRDRSHVVDQEIQRIIRLPLCLTVTPEEQEEFCRSSTLAEAFNSGWRLFDCQVGAILAYDLYDGGFFPIGVGWGKTLVSLMIAERAARKGLRSLLLVPPQVYPQLVNHDIRWARRHVPLSVQFHLLGGKSKERRLQMARTGASGCFVLPYSYLSTQDTDQLLELIAPGTIIADEAHLLKNSKAARTGRLFGRQGYITKHQPELVAMSGTITSRSLGDYWHIIKAALKDRCPLPLSSHLIRQWSGVLDSTPMAAEAATDDFYTEPIMPLVRWARKHWPDEMFSESTSGFRKAYKHRLRTAPGVVVTGDNEIGTSLMLRDNPVPKPDLRSGWTDLEEHIRTVREDWQAPNGDEIDHAMHSYKWLYELSAGFYNDLYWPPAEVLASERDISPRIAEGLLDRAKDHHRLQQLYHSMLRKWLTTRSRPGLDTPFLVGGDMERNHHKHVGRDLYECWRAMKDAEFEDMPERRSRPIRVCDYKVRAAADWAEQQRHGSLLWVYHREIGRWLSEMLPDALHCPAGGEANAAIIDPGNARRTVIASITAHGVGKNLQHVQHQYVVQWPRSAVAAEQLLGRTHRNGQDADELVVHMNSTQEIDTVNLAACLNDSAYIHQTTGVRQKMIYANYDPLPKVLSPQALRQAGAQNKMLTGEQIALLREKFDTV